VPDLERRSLAVVPHLERRSPTVVLDLERRSLAVVPHLERRSPTVVPHLERRSPTVVLDLERRSLAVVPHLERRSPTVVLPLAAVSDRHARLPGSPKRELREYASLHRKPRHIPSARASGFPAEGMTVVPDLERRP
jgi:hypothetical protein